MFQTGGFPDLDLSFLFCPFGTFLGIFPICSGTLRGFSRLVLFLFLGLLRAPTRNSPERVRDTIWTFPEKSGKHPGLETPRFSFFQKRRQEPELLDLAWKSQTSQTSFSQSPHTSVTFLMVLRGCRPCFRTMVSRRWGPCRYRRSCLLTLQTEKNILTIIGHFVEDTDTDKH